MVKSKYGNILILLVIMISIYAVLDFYPDILGGFTGNLDEYDRIKRDYEDMHQNFANEDYYEKRKEELLDKKDSLYILDKINQDEILRIIYGHCLNCNIEIHNYYFTEAVPVIVEDYDGKIEMINVNIEFYSSHENLIKFIYALQNNDVNISISNLHYTIGNKNNNLVKMDIKFYALAYGS